MNNTMFFYFSEHMVNDNLISIEIPSDSMRICFENETLSIEYNNSFANCCLSDWTFHNGCFELYIFGPVYKFLSSLKENGIKLTHHSGDMYPSLFS